MEYTYVDDHDYQQMHKTCKTHSDKSIPYAIVLVATGCIHMAAQVSAGSSMNGDPQGDRVMRQ